MYYMTLHQQWFARVADGRKRTEWRTRTRRDSIIEGMAPGDDIIIYEARTARTLRAKVRAVKGWTYDDGGYLYGIRVYDVRRGEDRPHDRHPQRVERR